VTERDVDTLGYREIRVGSILVRRNPVWDCVMLDLGNDESGEVSLTREQSAKLCAALRRIWT
jgi:hypothetical protein